MQIGIILILGIACIVLLDCNYGLTEDCDYLAKKCDELERKLKDVQDADEK